MRDWVRFLFLVLYFQSPVSFDNLSYPVSYFVKHRVFNINNQIVEKMIASRYVELVSFAFIPNHFHLIVHEKKENGISQYMQRILNAYTKYFNAKYKKQDIFSKDLSRLSTQKATNNSFIFLHIFTAIPERLRVGKIASIFTLFQAIKIIFKKIVGINFLKNQIIMDQFSSGEDYKKFTDTSGTKKETDENM